MNGRTSDNRRLLDDENAKGRDSTAARPARYNRHVLVRFDSRVGGFTMFGDIAVQLLKMMGHSGTVPSALLAKDISQALARLEAALAGAPAATAEARDEGDETPKVSLRQRAYPLIELLARAAQTDSDVLWDKA